MSKNQDVTEDMFKAYSALQTTHLILRALMPTPGISPLKLVIVGKQGTGKTAFAYYAVKVALGLRRCLSFSVPVTDRTTCLKFLRQKYGLCLGRTCPPDKLDEELREGMYVTVGDLLKRLPKDIRSGAIRERRVLFFDDAVIPGTYWHLGGQWREAYYALREFERFYRDFSHVFVITAPSLYHIDRVYRSNAVILMADVIHRREDNHYYNAYTKAAFQRVVTPNGGIRTVWRAEYIDMVLHTSAFGMPQWLEEELTERRYAVLKAAAERVLNHGKKKAAARTRKA